MAEEVVSVSVLFGCRKVVHEFVGPHRHQRGTGFEGS